MRWRRTEREREREREARWGRGVVNLSVTGRLVTDDYYRYQVDM